MSVNTTPAAPMNATEVALYLAQLGRELDAVVRILEGADRDAALKKGAYDLAMAHALLRAEGTADARKAQATVDCAALRTDSDVASVVVNHLKRRIDALKVRIDIGRSYGAAVRSELELLKTGAGGP